MEARLWSNHRSLNLGISALYTTHYRSDLGAAILSPIRWREPFGSIRIECDNQLWVSRDRSGGFDRPFVALLPAKVHPPRCDHLHHRQRREICLRRWDRAAYFCPVSEPRSRTTDSG